MNELKEKRIKGIIENNKDLIDKPLTEDLIRKIYNFAFDDGYETAKYLAKSSVQFSMDFGLDRCKKCKYMTGEEE